MSINVQYLFVWGFSSNSRIFHSYGDFTIAGEGLQILTYARHCNGHLRGPVTLTPIA